MINPKDVIATREKLTGRMRWQVRRVVASGPHSVLQQEVQVDRWAEGDVPLVPTLEWRDVMTVEET